MIKAILFDMDDTLLDWSKRKIDWGDHIDRHTRYVTDYIRREVTEIAAEDDVICAKMIELTKAAWHDASDTLRAPHIGDILMQTFITFGLSSRQLQREKLIEAYKWDVLEDVYPFEDVHDALSTFRDAGFKLGIVTNAFHPMASRMIELQAFDLDQYFMPDCLISAADVGYLKPHPTIFKQALACIGAEPHEVIFVGDSREADILGAKNAGMKAILRVPLDATAILASKIRPDATISSLEEIYDLLDEWSPNWR